MKRSCAAQLMVILLFLAVATSLQAATDKPRPDNVAKGENLALGRPYTFNVWPTVKFWLYEQRGAPLPDDWKRFCRPEAGDVE